MGKPAARLGDIASNHGPWPPTPILMGSGTVLINGLPAARKGDMVLLHVIPNNPPHGRAINAGASKVKIDGIPAARVDDAISCGGKVAAGSGNVLIGDSPGKASPTKVNIPDITFPSQSGKIVKGTSPEPISTTPMATIEGQKFTETGHVNDTEVHVEAGHIHAADEELYTVEDGAVATLNYLAEGNNMIEALGSAASLIQNPEALVASLAAAAVSVAALPAAEQGEAAAKQMMISMAEQGIGDKETVENQSLYSFVGNNSSKEELAKSTNSKQFEADSFESAISRLEQRKKQIQQSGYSAKYTDEELEYLANHGDVGGERFQARVMPASYLKARGSDVPLSGMLGGEFDSKKYKGAKYWSTSLDQLEDKDTDFELLCQSLGIDYKGGDYVMVMIDTEKAAPLTGCKSIAATFGKTSDFVNQELADEFPKELTDKIMTPEFQAQYAELMNSFPEEAGLNVWNPDPEDLDELLGDMDYSTEEKKLLVARARMNQKIGNNKDYLGTGLTQNNIPTMLATGKQAGCVETINFERTPVTLQELQDAGAINIIYG